MDTALSFNGCRASYQLLLQQEQRAGGASEERELRQRQLGPECC